jgi:23S rRNA (cytosine1962-C5)-methyltransferase
VIKYPTDWKDFELIDSGNGEKLERWANILISRPDPQALWQKDEKAQSDWNNVDFYYTRSQKGGGFWQDRHKNPITKESSLPTAVIKYGDLKFHFKLTSFKHTLIFPEQAVNWNFIREQKAKNILNLFAYTGGATLAGIAGRAKVTHVDSSGGMIGIAQSNLEMSQLDKTSVRFIKDDALKFVDKELRRGTRYEAVILDPPVYGRGSKGELWQIEKDLPNLLFKINKLLAHNKKYVMLNVYANNYSIYSFVNICRQIFVNSSIEYYEIGIVQTLNKFILPAGATILVKF